MCNIKLFPPYWLDCSFHEARTCFVNDVDGNASLGRGQVLKTPSVLCKMYWRFIHMYDKSETNWMRYFTFICISQIAVEFRAWVSNYIPQLMRMPIVCPYANCFAGLANIFL